MNDCKKPNDWERGHEQGLRDAAQLLAIYPEGYTIEHRWILDQKRKEILAAAGGEETKPANIKRLGDGVTAQMVGDELRLSVQNGNEGDAVTSESVILMSKDTCEGLMRYIRQNVFFNEP